MDTYKNLNVHQRINSKANTLVTFGKDNAGRLMRQAKKGMLSCVSNRLNLRDESENNNRNYDGPGDDYYSGYYGGDWGKYVDDHRMIEAQKLK